MLTGQCTSEVAARKPSPMLHRQVIRSVMSAVVPRRWFMTRGPARPPLVGLTFDDGPHPEHTPAILDVLKEQRVLATFFIVGQRAATHPELIQRMVAEGHSIGLHSFHHKLPSETSASELMKEVEQSIVLLKETAGLVPRLFRPPHGKLSVGKLIRLWLARQTIALWSVDPRDYACQSSAQLLAQLRGAPLRGGDIVLLHDNQPHAAPVLEAFIRETRTHGFDFCTLDRWTAH